MSENPTGIDEQRRAMQQRVELLERENERLREQLGLSDGPINPCFDLTQFRRVLSRTLFLPMIPMWLGMFLPAVFLIPSLRNMGILHQRVAHIPVVDFGGSNSGVPGIGLGMIAYGGASLGLISFGGFGVGLIAYGGGAIGFIAIGGGSLGLIAVGGGACGYIALGGGACGRYVMADRGAGKYVLARNRQDDQAIEFFVRYIPGLRRAVTLPMPVILLETNRDQSAATINSQPASRTSA